MTSLSPSPWPPTIGELLPQLHPRLRPYFEALPGGAVGEGDGIFERVGCRRRWLRPLVLLFAREGILFPVWERDVPFTVRNTPGTDNAGNPRILGERTFRFAGGDRIMVDAITAVRASGQPRQLAEPDQLVDFLGVRGRIGASFTAAVEDGGLLLTSTTVFLRLGRRRLQVPGAVAPVVRLTERFSPDDGRQHIGLTLDLPLVGRLYEYAGSFTYTIVRGTEGSEQAHE